MDYAEKIKQLNRYAEDALGPLVGNRVIIPDAPYYNNVGDILIWQGMVDFLKHTGRQLISVSNGTTFQYQRLDENVTILLTGGGNFGDLWHRFQNDRLKIISRYPHNRIVMCPQSVWYEDASLIRADADVFARHPDLHLCARDRWSYDFLKKHFGRNHVYLVPDMAFCIADGRLTRYRGKDTCRRLFLRRFDKELTASTPASLTDGSDICDWPTLEHRPGYLELFDKAFGISRRLKRSHIPACLFNKWIDLFAERFILTAFFEAGCEFLRPYAHVTTTRLHAMILAILLHKPVQYIDNSTGKLSAFVDTWLTDLSHLKVYE